MPRTTLLDPSSHLGSRTTPRLIEDCLEGDEVAWARLVDAYKNLVHAVIRRSPRTAGEEADLFQAVWIDIYRELPKLRSHDAISSWIATLTRHKCYHWGQRARHVYDAPWNDDRARKLTDPRRLQDQELEEIERQQQVREVVHQLEPRCRTLMELLFLSDPPLPYRRVAENLGIAVGTIGSMRATCLQRLKERLAALRGDRSEH